MTPSARHGRSSWTIAAIVVAACVAGAIFAGLGTWQMKRLAWKLALIERVEASLAQEPVPTPGPDAWATPTFAPAEYQRVRLRGRYLPGQDTLVQAVSDLGSGHWVLTPFASESGFIVLVNRGFVDKAHRDPSTWAATDHDVSGLLRLTEPGGAFLRHNEPAADRWYSRDVAAIASRRGLANAAPYFVDADRVGASGDWPVGGLTRVAFSNNHAVYAVTWFVLAAMALAGGAYVVIDARRRIVSPPRAQQVEHS